MTLCFFLAAFRILSLIFTIFIRIYLDVGLFWFILFGTFFASCTWIFVSFFRFHKFSVIIYSNTFHNPSLSSPSETPIMGMLVHLMLSQRSLKLFSFFKVCFSFYCTDWVISIIPSSRSLMHSSLSLSCYSFFLVCVFFLKTSFYSSSFLLINLFIYLFLFIYLWLCWVFVAACGLSLVVVSGGYS